MGSDEIRFDGPVLQVWPDIFSITSIRGEPIEDDTLTISCIGSEDLEYSVIPGNESWLALAGQLAGVLQPGECSVLLLQFDVSPLDLGVYLDTITVLSDDPLSPMKTVPISLKILSDGIIHVPGDQSTIQGAIDLAYHGATVLVADGTYSGCGNMDLDFSGKAITVTLENRASGAVIDLRNEGRGFCFHSGESENSRIEGFTIVKLPAPRAQGVLGVH